VSMTRPSRPLRVRDLLGESREGFQLEPVAGLSGLSRRIREITVNRPGLALAGFYNYFAHKRVQVLGSAEVSYLKSLSANLRHERMRALLAQHVPCVIYARSYRPEPEVIELANRTHTPLLRCALITMDLINRLTLFLERRSAPRAMIQAGMIDIQGVGVLLRGRSGIGKSESMLSLLKRGYSLVSDDVTQVTRITTSGEPELIGSSAEMTRFQMEVRGLGIINVPAVFGITSVRAEKRVDMVITLKDWEAAGEIDRLGLTRETYEILEIPVPHVVLPVTSGRDIAQLVEVAAMDQKLRTLGYHPAMEFDRRVREVLKRRASAPEDGPRSVGEVGPPE